MKQIFLIFLSILPFLSFGQTITTTPEFPVATQAVSITFDLSGTDLEDESSDIYAHTGVTTESNGQWQYVIGDWGDNSSQPQLTKISNNTYQLNITPNIYDFYGVPTSKVITQLCLVLRNADGSAQTAQDIFISIYSEQDINISTPDPTHIYSVGEDVQINAVSLFASTMTLFVNNDSITSFTDNHFTYNYTATSSGKIPFKITATDGSITQEKESSFFVRGANNIAELPAPDLKDGINYIDDNTVCLVLYAPDKTFAFVRGSFDNWDLSLNNQMNKSPDGKRYWITLNNLTPGQEYTYQYIVDATITIADPYCDKVLDPWNDSYISSATYPGLIPYPTEKTSGIVSVFQTAQTPYQWQTSNFTRPENKDLIIYELHIRDFIAAHDYSTLIDTISYLKNLGINSIELMPVNEFEGNSSWGYNPSFYFAPDKYYGTKNDLKRFIDSCHANGIAVINDIVLNHSFGQSPLVQLYFDPNAGEWGQPTANNPWYNETSPNTEYSWGYDFNHESQDTKEFVYRVCNYWLSEYKFDGFRFDFTKGFTNTPGNGSNYDASRIAILKDYANHIWANEPGAYVILEHFADNSEEKILADYGMMIWGNSNYNFAQASMAWNDGWDFSWASYKQRNWNEPNLVSYMESHDEERMMFRNKNYGNSSGSYDIKNQATALKRVELAAAFFFAIPGPKMIWQFGELGYDISIDDPCRVCEKPILWNYYDVSQRKNLYEYFKIFIELKKNHAVFSTADYDIDFGDAIKTITLRSADLNVLVIGNFDVEEHYKTPNLSAADLWYDYYTHEEYTYGNIITLAPGEYKILTSEQLAIPDIPSSVKKAEEANRQSVYPNPTGGTLYVKNSRFIKYIKIRDVNGKTVKQIYKPKNSSIDVKELPSGIYFMEIGNTKQSSTHKFIKQ